MKVFPPPVNTPKTLSGVLEMNVLLFRSSDRKLAMPIALVFHVQLPPRLAGGLTDR
jgi:hypothetical protein